MIAIEDFSKVEMRVGTIKHVEENKKAKKPAYIMEVDFGKKLGIKGTSAQLCQNYKIENLLGKQVIAVVNFPPIRVAGYKSEILVLAAVCEEKGTVLIETGENVVDGTLIA